jgi:hypothetical protein
VLKLALEGEDPATVVGPLAVKRIHEFYKLIRRR